MKKLESLKNRKFEHLTNNEMNEIIGRDTPWWKFN